VQLVGQNLAEMGLPAALVRMQEAPSAELQASTIGFLLVLTVPLVLILIVLAFVVVPGIANSSEILQVVAITLLALPVYAVRAVPMAMMDREMQFGRVAAVEAADTIGFNCFALTAALLGLGVFSLSGAVPFGATLGTLVTWIVRRRFVRRPRFDFARVRPLIGFGSRVSVLGMLYLGRDLGFVTVIGAIGGTSMAGYYAMAKRFFSFPVALSAAVSRVTLPALSQSGSQRSARAARMLGQIALVCGLPMALLVGAIQPLVTVLLGSRWLPTCDIVIFGALSMMLVASLAAPMNAYFLAEGKPDAPVAAIGLELIVSLALTALLIEGLHSSGIGIAMSIGSLASAVVLLRSAGPTVRRGATAMGRAIAIAFVAAVAGQLLPVHDGLAGLAASLAAACATWLALSTLFSKPEMASVLSRARTLIP